MAMYVVKLLTQNHSCQDVTDCSKLLWERNLHLLQPTCFALSEGTSRTHLPLHVIPSPLYPVWHPHVKDPSVLVQEAFPWQGDSPAHSLISAGGRVQNIPHGIVTTCDYSCRLDSSNQNHCWPKVQIQWERTIARRSVSTVSCVASTCEGSKCVGTGSVSMTRSECHTFINVCKRVLYDCAKRSIQSINSHCVQMCIHILRVNTQNQLRRLYGGCLLNLGAEISQGHFKSQNQFKFNTISRVKINLNLTLFQM